MTCLVKCGYKYGYKFDIKKYVHETGFCSSVSQIKKSEENHPLWALFSSFKMRDYVTNIKIPNSVFYGEVNPTFLWLPQF